MKRQPIAHLGAVPVAFDPISAGISVGMMAFSAWLSRRGPQQKVASTSIVNELEPVLKENLDLYLAGPRTKVRQSAHLAQFDQAWAYLKSAEGCGNQELGRPGQNCIADRSRGGRWDWASYYRDPIANDPEALADTATTPAAGGGQAAGTVDVSSPLSSNPYALAIAAAILLAVVL